MKRSDQAWTNALCLGIIVKMKRTVAEYSKESPHSYLNEYAVVVEAVEMSHLFEIEDDADMIFVYQIKTPEQAEFFKKLGVPVDLTKSFWYIESTDE